MMHSHMTNTRVTDPEVLEQCFLVRVEEFSIHLHSDGSGWFQCDDGVIRRIRFLAPMTATILSSPRRIEPYDLAGGSPGLHGRNAVLHANGSLIDLRGNVEIDMDLGDQCIIKTPGTIGFGRPIQ